MSIQSKTLTIKRKASDFSIRIKGKMGSNIYHIHYMNHTYEYNFCDIYV